MDTNIFDHFDLPKDTSGNFKAKCRECTTTISGSLKVTSNFITHMRRKHRDILTDVKKEKKCLDQPTLNTFVKEKSKYSSIDPTQMKITNALVLFIAGDLQPLSIVESKYFRNLMETANQKYQLPSRKHLSQKLLSEKSKEVKQNLKAQLDKADSVCLTVDIWSNRQMKGFLGITAHFITDWIMNSRMLCCKRFKGKHTSENIRHEYEEIIAFFEISDKINYVITDNASNMVKAFAFALPGYKSEEKSHSDDDDSSFMENDSDNDEDENDFLECLPQHSRCYAHTLQLVVKDGLKDCGSHLRTVIAKASNIVNYARKSTLATDILEDEKRLQASNITRWNSQLQMIRSVLNVDEEKLNRLDCNNKLTAYERKLLQELCSILEPFERATLLVQKDLRASLTIPVTLGLKHQISKIAGTYNMKMINTLKSSTASRLIQFENDESYIVAAILDPRFKLRWCEPSKLDENTTLMKHIANNVATNENSDNSSSSPPQKRARPDDFFSFLPDDTTSRKRHTSGAANETDLYLSEPCIDMSANPLEFWKTNNTRLPVLSTLSMKYLAIPASSAPVERLFSIAGKVFRPDRSRLNDDIFETLMMIKCNANLD